MLLIEIMTSKKLLSFSATPPRGPSYQPPASYLFKTIVILLQMIALRNCVGAQKPLWCH